MATKLAKLRIDEVSGVDEPANDSQDWIVMKSKGVLKEIEQVEEDAGSLHGLLQKDEIFSGAPESVEKAREKLSEHLDNILQEDEDEEEESETTSTVKSRLQVVFGIKKAADEDEEEEEEDEEPEATKKEADSEEEETDEEEDEEPEATKKDKAEEADEDDEDDEQRDDLDEDGIAKSTDDESEEILKELLDNSELVREAVLNIADRVEALEKSPGRSSLYGQEGTVEKKAPSLTDAIRHATRGNRVTLR